MHINEGLKGNSTEGRKTQLGKELNMAEEINSTVTPEEEGQEPKTYTQEEVDALLQAETDRRVTSALKKAEEKNRARVKEAEKLAQMNEQEKYRYELDRREQAIVEKERALALAENKNEAAKILEEKGLSLQLVDFVVAEDAETMNENIKLLDKAFKASVKAEVERRLGSNTPTKNLPPDEAITKESFSRMSLQEQSDLYKTNPELYKSLTS